MKSYTLLCIIVCSCLSFGLAQNRVVVGQIMNNEEPLIGASILNLQDSTGTTTDVNGSFLMTNITTEICTLEIRFIGYQTRRIELIVPKDEMLNIGQIQLEEGTMLESIVIVEKLEAGGERKANMMMLESSRISTIVGAEGIERLPDKNAAEALSRIAGVVMESDQGEGRYISFRGTPTDWSSALVNGDRMPVANEELEGRAMNFDVLPTSLIEYIENNQNLTPDIEGDAIGGSANFYTKEIADDQVFELQAAYGYNFKAEKPLQNGSLLYSNRFFNKKLGFLVGGSIYNRNWATDNYEIFYGNNDNHSIERMELRKYNGRRTTFGGHYKLDYRINPNHTIYSLGFIGRMNDDEFNRKTMYNWVVGVGQSIRLQNIHNILQHQLYGGEVGGNHKIADKWELDWKVASYDASFEYGPVPFGDGDSRNGYFVIEFEQQVRFQDYLYLDVDGNVTDEVNAFTRLVLLDIDSPVEGYGDPYDNIQPDWENIVPVKPSDTTFAFVKAFTELNTHKERDPIVGRFDLTYNASNTLKYKFGAKYRYKEGSRQIGLDAWQRNPFDPGVILYEEFNPIPIRSANTFLEEIGNPYKGRLFPFMDDETIDNFIPTAGDRLVYLPFNENTPFYKQFVGSTYNYDEQVIAGYGLFDLKTSKNWTVNAGVRVENTEVEVVADSVIFDLMTFTNLLVERRINRNYTAILPMVNIKYNLANKSNLRLALTRTFRRPNFNELKPGTPEIHYSHFHLLRGNPDLRPTFSWNGDISYQKFFGLKGYFIVGLFYKYVTDHIFTTFESGDLEGNSVAGQFAVPGGIIAKAFQNAPYAHVGGFEVSFVRQLRELPWILKNLEIAFNYSFTESRMKIGARDELQPLPRQAKHVFNARLTYETDRINANVALNYRSPYLMELNLFAVTDPATGEQMVLQQNTDYDVFMGLNLSMDASVSYDLTKYLSIYAEANNLLNTPFVLYRGRRERPVQTEFYGIRGLAGLRVNLQ